MNTTINTTMNATIVDTDNVQLNEQVIDMYCKFSNETKSTEDTYEIEIYKNINKSLERSIKYVNSVLDKQSDKFLLKIISTTKTQIINSLTIIEKENINIKTIDIQIYLQLCNMGDLFSIYKNYVAINLLSMNLSFSEVVILNDILNIFSNIRKIKINVNFMEEIYDAYDLHANELKNCLLKNNLFEVNNANNTNNFKKTNHDLFHLFISKYVLPLMNIVVAKYKYKNNE